MGNTIVKFDTATKKFTLFPVPTPAAMPDVSIVGPGGNIWFSEITGDKIGYLNPDTGAIQEFPLPSDSVSAFDIQWNRRTGPGSAMIVDDVVANKIYRFDTTTEQWTRDYTIPTPTSAPCATGFIDGKVYVGELAGGNVAVVPDN
jgi:virginiamycin B lyase